ncbi:Aldo-keto reductase IolS [Emticicia aquatica]|uniref:Aldo-keto reductase IolS n=1 Tax=Emticicia aquatica TaxID=1681835 RepID=A0ABN8ETX0_9BACT|nr:Aldo-keto reductase IolS [Emticicia aquatica]
MPLASGLLTGKFSKHSTFTAGDHRNFNRNGEMFDKGETFSGIDYETGLVAVDALKNLFPQNENLTPIALKWILQHDEISTIIPGASRPEQVLANLEALNFPALSQQQIIEINEVYSKFIKKSVHQLW